MSVKSASIVLSKALPLRKAIHVSTIFLLFLLKHLPREADIAILVSLSVVAGTIELLRLTVPKFKEYFIRELGSLLKDDEKRGKPTGATFLICSMTLAYILFPFKIFYYASLIAILVDGLTPVFTAIIFQRNGKDHTHLITFLISGVIVAFIVNSGIPILVKLTGSITIALIEYFNPPPDDNIYAEFLGALIIYLLFKAS
ncbi:MAG: hypothetical protein ABIM31_06235 [candidate division WOR-3 bacterium]